jgi:hypothetical protein
MAVGVKVDVHVLVGGTGVFVGVRGTGVFVFVAVGGTGVFVGVGGSGAFVFVAVGGTAVQVFVLVAVLVGVGNGWQRTAQKESPLPWNASSSRFVAE